MKVLLAVESCDLRMALDLFLREQPGVTVAGATCRSDGALALLRAMEFDLVLLQWRLPGSPGVDFLHEVRSLPHSPRILVLSERAIDGQAALSGGADAFVMVGESPRHLLDAIETIASGEFGVQSHASIE